MVKHPFTRLTKEELDGIQRELELIERRTERQLRRERINDILNQVYIIIIKLILLAFLIKGCIVIFSY